jgi:tRNA G18 (ribose-2'-O)-methylase SpoU
MENSPLMRLFADLPDRDLRREGVIIGEGRLVAQRVAAFCEPIAVLAVPELGDFAAALSRDRCPVTLVPEAEIASLAGYPFHRGILIAAVRPHLPPLSAGLPRGARRLILLPSISDAENLGAIARSAAALGWDALAIGVRAADPWGRRALRTSMGATLALSLYRLEGGAELERLKADGWTLQAAANEAGAERPESLRGISRLALVLGHEHDGIAAEVRRHCPRTVAIPQLRTDAAGVDSLNVAAAAAILLWEGRP